MKFQKLVKAEDDGHYIPTGLLNALVMTAENTAKYANDMAKAGVKLSIEQQTKIKEAMNIISDKLDEIRNTII